MPLITWTEDLSVGVEILDNDHRRLIDLLNGLYDRVEDGQGPETVGPTLDGLVAYTVEHFKREEALFARTGYPHAAAHTAQHDALCKQVLDAQQRYRAGASEALSLELVDFLKTWIINHIQDTDRKYGPHLNACGVR